MKSYFYILFFLYSLQLSTSKEVQISNPIIADYYDCIYKDNQIIVYGTNGIINISNDDGKTWATQKIFDRGKIVFMSYENDGIYAVNENGEIIKSENNGRFFKPYSNFTVTPDKRIWSMKKFEDKFLIRTINSISLLDKNFSLIKKETLPTLNESMYAYTDSLLTQFVNNFVVFKDNIIVSLDSAQFMVFDKSLNIKEKRNLFFELDKSYNLVPIFISKDKIIFDTYYYTFKYDLT